MRVFLCSTVICCVVNNRVHIEDTCTGTTLPECTLVCKFLFRNHNLLLECLFNITIQTGFIKISNCNFEFRSISFGSRIVSQSTYSLRVHRPNQVVRSVVKSIRQESEYKVRCYVFVLHLNCLNRFFSILNLRSGSFIPICSCISSNCQFSEVYHFFVFLQFYDFYLFVDSMELSFADTLSTVKLNHMVNLLVHLLREQLLEHILASYSIVRECDSSNRLVLFTGPTHLDVTNRNHVTLILIPQLCTNDRLTTDRSLGEFIIFQINIVDF